MQIISENPEPLSYNISDSTTHGVIVRIHTQKWGRFYLLNSLYCHTVLTYIMWDYPYDTLQEMENGKLGLRNKIFI